LIENVTDIDTIRVEVTVGRNTPLRVRDKLISSTESRFGISARHK